MQILLLLTFLTCCYHKPWPEGRKLLCVVCFFWCVLRMQIWVAMVTGNQIGGNQLLVRYSHKVLLWHFLHKRKSLVNFNDAQKFTISEVNYMETLFVSQGIPAITSFINDRNGSQQFEKVNYKRWLFVLIALGCLCSCFSYLMVQPEHLGFCRTTGPEPGIPRWLEILHFKHAPWGWVPLAVGLHFE